ncbi:hypothetical protein TWF718_010132 [Orbilia javanica]|uniref:F-box domain-containing protein n=1 Tax=Orbilia javanica TaxID=47235 RepID=A0AAN8MNW4_9PEZI
MASGPPAVALTTLPTEITFLVLSFLSPKEYKTFSLASKVCRKNCIPIIFRRVRLFPENTHLWENNPAICAVVRHVSLHALQCRHEAELMDFWRVCTNAVGLFPHIVGIKLLYPSRSSYLQRKEISDRTSLDNKHLQFDNRVFGAIFSTLSTFPFYYSQLKKLHIETDRFYSMSEQYPLNISAENQEFLNTTNRVMAARGLSSVPFPRGLEEAVLTSRLVCFTPPGYNLHAFTALQYCKDSLKSFSILGTPEDFTKLYSRGPRPKDAYIKFPILRLDISDYIYPNVTTLCISSSFMTDEFLYELPVRFPGVQELRIHDPSVKLGLRIAEHFEEITSMLRAFKGLKRVILPWPLEETDRLDWESPDWDPVPPVNVEHLETMVRSWLGDRELVELERAAFWLWDTGSKGNYCDAAIFDAKRKWMQDIELNIKRVRCGSKEEMFPILGKGWETVCWVDYSIKLARGWLVIG